MTILLEELQLSNVIVFFYSYVAYNNRCSNYLHNLNIIYINIHKYRLKYPKQQKKHLGLPGAKRLQ